VPQRLLVSKRTIWDVKMFPETGVHKESEERARGEQTIEMRYRG
jgi:hypothetical protein